MLVGGCPTKFARHAERVCFMALAMMEAWEEIRRDLQAQLGIDGAACYPPPLPLSWWYSQFVPVPVPVNRIGVADQNRPEHRAHRRWRGRHQESALQIVW